MERTIFFRISAIVLVIGAILFVGKPYIASSQTSVLTADLSISSIPLDPKPFESVTLTAQSYAVDLDQATLYWKYNGVMVQSGVGKRTITVTAPASGQTGTVELSVAALGGGATASFLIRPASVDMLWQAVDAYAPPFYRGKALAPVGAAVKVVAIPSIAAPKQVVYRWSENNIALQASSGYGKSSVVVTPELTATNETVSVALTSGTFTGNGSVALTTSEPAIVAYPKNEGFVDYAHGMTSTITASGPGTTVRFEPYYFSTPTHVPNDLAWNLTVDNESVIGDPSINELRFSKPATAASAHIGVGVSTSAYTLQNLSKNFTLSFN